MMNAETFHRVLVLGSNSFTGGHFVQHVIAHTDCEVVGVSRSPEYDSIMLPYRYRKERPARFAFHQLDLNHDLDAIMELCDAFKPELIVNFAAQGEVRNSWRWPEQWYETNCIAIVRLTTQLAQRDYLQKYVASSTPEVYGATGENMKESREYNPSTPYGASKLAGDLHLMTLHKRYGFPVALTRAANVYGIHQQLYRIIPRAIIYAKLGRKLTLHGGGRVERAFIHARDVADATWKAATHGGAGEVYHLAPEGELRSIRSVVGLVLKIAGAEFDDMVELQDENYGQDDRFSLDAAKAREQLNWNAMTSFENGVAETADWIDQNWETISKMNLEYEHRP